MVYFLVGDFCDRIFVHLLELILGFQTYYISLLEDEEIHYELADDFEDIRQQQRVSGTGNHDNTLGISNVRSHHIPVKYQDTGILSGVTFVFISVFNLFIF